MGSSVGRTGLSSRSMWFLFSLLVGLFFFFSVPSFCSHIFLSHYLIGTGLCHLWGLCTMPFGQTKGYGVLRGFL